jgi:hypothetical protein
MHATYLRVVMVCQAQFLKDFEMLILQSLELRVCMYVSMYVRIKCMIFSCMYYALHLCIYVHMKCFLFA